MNNVVRIPSPLFGIKGDLMMLLSEMLSVGLLDSDRTGFNLALFQLKENICLERSLVGEMPIEKAARSYEFANEKCQRTRKYFMESPGPGAHLTSYDTRNPEKNEWGGAVIFELYGVLYVGAISGLPECADEAFMVHCIVNRIKGARLLAPIDPATRHEPQYLQYVLASPVQRLEQFKMREKS